MFYFRWPSVRRMLKRKATVIGNLLHSVWEEGQGGAEGVEVAFQSRRKCVELKDGFWPIGKQSCRNLQ
jgi:hypothetical protein